MKTTVKTDIGRVVVQSLKVEGGVLLTVMLNQVMPSIVLTPDQCGALIFGIEQALEVIDQRSKAAAL